MDGDRSRELLDLISSGWITQAIYAGTELGVFELLAERPRSAEDIAAAAGCSLSGMTSLLRGLASLGLVRSEQAGTFALTELGLPLTSASPNSLRHWARFWGSHMWSVFAELRNSVR